jgi:hypothetical protein
MSQENKRKCGHRKVGGTYLVSDPGVGLSCIVLPYEVTSCPCCFEGIKFSRGYKWFVPNKLFSSVDSICTGNVKGTCLMNNNCPLRTEDKSGIMWVGEKFYTPQTFTEEAEEFGVSKRIASVPRDFEIGKTWVFLAHKNAGKNKRTSAIFYVFKPTRIEKIVTEEQYRNQDEMNTLRSRGIIPIPVPDEDYDHRGTAYDRVHGKSLFKD